MSDPARRAGVVVVGGGLAGAMAAAHLARVGVPVIVFEQSLQPQPAVCGEFLSFEGAALVREIGADLPQEAHAIDAVAVHGPRHTLIARLPEGNLGVSRMRLDEALRQRAGQLGAVVHRGVTVHRLTPLDDSGTLVQTSGGDWQADAVIVATGKRDLRGVAARERTHEVVGVQLHVSIAPQVRARMHGRVSLWVGEGAYGGVALVDDTTLNVSCVITPQAARTHGLCAADLMPALMQSHPAAARVLAEIVWPAVKMTAVAPVPYGYVRPVPPGAGLWCVGDQLAVIPSLTGDGMTMALASGRKAAMAIVEGWSAGPGPAVSRSRNVDTRGLRGDRLRAAAERYHTDMVQAFGRQVRVAVRLQQLFARPRVLDPMLRLGAWLPPVVPLLVRATRVPHALRASGALFTGSG